MMKKDGPNAEKHLSMKGRPCACGVDAEMLSCFITGGAEDTTA
jgi:hypothetical protein